MTSPKPPLRVAFRTDASLEIGTGHVMRCLTLAAALREQGADCVYLCRQHDGHLLNVIANEGYDTFVLPRGSDVGQAEDQERRAEEPSHAHWVGTDWQTDAAASLEALAAFSEAGRFDWLVVDHYGLDARWEKMLRPAVGRLMVIDDLADRPHDCDLLLDQSLDRVPEDYAGLVSHDTTMLLGSPYALLRPEFARLRAESLARRAQPKLQQVLVTMGGVDKGNATGQVLDALDNSVLPEGVRIIVVLGAKAPWLDTVRNRAARMRYPTEARIAVTDMARLMAESDLAIGAGGTTTWERCALGLPAVQVSLAENQRGINIAVSRAGAALHCEVSNISHTLHFLLDDPAMPERLGEMGRSAARITDGQGAALVRRFLFEDAT